MVYEATKADYDQGNEWHARKSEGHSWAPQIETFLEMVRPGAKVLDVGCGNGRDIRIFKKMNVHAEGLDFSSVAIENARKLFPANTFYVADMRTTGLPDEQYGGVWACATIINLMKAALPDALSEFRRLLEPNGGLFVSAKEGEGERMVPDRAGERLFSLYTEAELKGLVMDAGFTIAHSDVMEDTWNESFEGKKPPSWISLYAKKK